MVDHFHRKDHPAPSQQTVLIGCVYEHDAHMSYQYYWEMGS